MTFPRVFAVWYKDLDRWDTTFFRGIRWCWPRECFVSVGSLLERKLSVVDHRLPNEEKPIIEKISFGGELTITQPESRDGYKGRLFWAKAGEFIYSKIRVKQGSCTIIPATVSALAVSAEYPVYKIKSEKILPSYFSLLIRCNPFQQLLDGLSHGGSTKTRIHPTQFEAIQVPIPSLMLQQAIVDRWQQVQAEIASAQQEAQKCERNGEKEFLHGLGLQIPNQISRHKYYVIQWRDLDRWGVDVNRPAQGFDVAASCYPVHTLGSLIDDLENGWSPQCLTRPAALDEWGVLKLGAVSFGVFNQDENKALPEGLQPIPRYEVKLGNLLISRANITRLVGACVLVKETRPKLMMCDKIFRVIWKCQGDVLPEYLDEVMKIPHLRYQIENALTGSSPTMKNISKPALLALRLPLPPKDVQQRLIDAISEQRQKAAGIRVQATERQKQIKVEIEAMILGTKKMVNLGVTP